MKFVIVAALALVAVVAAAPQQKLENVPIIRAEFDQQPNGPYQLNVETGDGTVRQETGELRTVNDEENKPREVIVVRGSYTYVDTEGKPVTVTYYADETGFHAEGETIPKSARR